MILFFVLWIIKSFSNSNDPENNFCTTVASTGAQCFANVACKYFMLSRGKSPFNRIIVDFGNYAWIRERIIKIIYIFIFLFNSHSLIQVSIQTALETTRAIVWWSSFQQHHISSVGSCQCCWVCCFVVVVVVVDWNQINYKIFFFFVVIVVIIIVAWF